MIKSLKNFFGQTENKIIPENNDLYLLCGLMMETASIDGVIDQSELNKISNTLINIFKEDPLLVEREIKKCSNEVGDNKSLHFFTSRINKSFDGEKKVKLIEILWEIILEDNKIHDFESNLIRRLAGLLYISDVECGNAKIKALSKIQIND